MLHRSSGDRGARSLLLVDPAETSHLAQLVAKAIADRKQVVNVVERVRKLERRMLFMGSVLPVVGLLALVGFDGPIKRSVVRVTTDILFPGHPQSLIAATRKGDVELVTDLLERGADAQFEIVGYTSAYQVAEKNHNRDLLDLFGQHTARGSAEKVAWALAAAS